MCAAMMIFGVGMMYDKKRERERERESEREREEEDGV